MEYSTPIPLGVWQIATHAETHPLSPHLVEDYQIAFFCDNLFLPGPRSLGPERERVFFWYCFNLLGIPSFATATTGLEVGNPSRAMGYKGGYGQRFLAGSPAGKHRRQ
jgi:hypothetical protein